MVSTMVPAYPMSQHDVRFDVNFDGGLALNGYAQISYLNPGVAAGGTAPYTLTKDLWSPSR